MFNSANISVDNVVLVSSQIYCLILFYFISKVQILRIKLKKIVFLSEFYDDENLRTINSVNTIFISVFFVSIQKNI